MTVASRSELSPFTLDLVPASTTEEVRLREHQQQVRLRRVLTTLVIAIILLQRISIPYGGTSHLSVILPIVLAALAYLVADGLLVVDRRRTMHYLLVAGIAASVTLVDGLRDLPISTTSIGLLLLAYTPFCLRVRTDLRQVRIAVITALSRVLTVIALVALAQFVAQLVRVWTYQDLLAKIVPTHFLTTGYVTSYPITYGSPIFRSNGLVLLEPSFCSQFMALGVVCQLVLRRGYWRIPLFVLALLSTLSGTGLLLLGAALLVTVVQRGRRFAFGVVAALLVVGTAVAVSPLGSLYAQRTTELSTSNSSGNQRFVAPYQRYWDHSRSSFTDVLLGEGAGASSTQTRLLTLYTGAPATEPAQTKLPTEYGLIGGLPFLVWLVSLFAGRSPNALLGVVLFLFYFVASPSLLTVETLYLPLLLYCLYPVARMSWTRPVQQTPAVHRLTVS